MSMTQLSGAGESERLAEANVASATEPFFHCATCGRAVGEGDV